MTADQRPFRFGLQASFAEGPDELRELSRRAEATGFDVVTIADHLGIIDPFIGASVVAEATTSLRVGTHVLNIDFHPAGLLARATATIDLTSGGRFELGLGTGYMRAEYDAAGLAFDPPGVRIGRLADTITILRGLFAGETVDHDGAHRSSTAQALTPLPPQGAALPILVGGNGDRVLDLAATAADIVGFTGFGWDPEAGAPTLTHMTAEGFSDRVARVDSHGTDPERQTLVQRVIVTDDREAAAAELAEALPIGDGDAVIDSPFVLIGTVDQICDEIVQRRALSGVSYLTVFAGRVSPEFDQVVERLAGT
ncbi:MAG: TIGR03621 family F420-dependent LLM class oxidoreductase [Actinomycetota bacterium]